MSILLSLSVKTPILRGLFAALMCVSTSAWAKVQEDTYSTMALDWELINVRLADVAQDHINAFGFILDAHAEVDTQSTDWDAGNLKMRFDVQSTDLSLLSTPNPMSVQLNGQFDLQTTDLGADQKIDIAAEISLNGDVISVLRHVNELIADCSTYDRSDLFMVNFCAYSDHIMQNSDASSYQPALESLRDALITLSPTHRLPLLPFTYQKSWMDEFFSVLASALVTGDEDSSSVVADIDLSTFLNFPVQGTVTLKISNESLSIILSGQALLPTAEYDAYKNTLHGGLILFQDGDADFMSEIYQYSFLIFGLIEGFLN